MKEQRKRVSPREQSGKLPSIHTDRESIDRVSHSLRANQLLLLSIRADSEHLLLLKRSACVCVTGTGAEARKPTACLSSCSSTQVMKSQQPYYCSGNRVKNYPTGSSSTNTVQLFRQLAATTACVTIPLSVKEGTPLIITLSLNT